MMIILTLNSSEMRVIFVVLISAIFAFPPNMSFLRELFSNLPSSGKYFKVILTIHSLAYNIETFCRKLSRCKANFLVWDPLDFERWLCQSLKCSKNVFLETKIWTIPRSYAMDRTDESTVWSNGISAIRFSYSNEFIIPTNHNIFEI